MARPPGAAAAPRGARSGRPSGPASFRPSKHSHRVTFLPLFPNLCSAQARPSPLQRGPRQPPDRAGKAMRRRDRLECAPLTPPVLTVVFAVAATSHSELPNHLLSSFTCDQSFYIFLPSKSHHLVDREILHAMAGPWPPAAGAARQRGRPGRSRRPASSRPRPRPPGRLLPAHSEALSTKNSPRQRLLGQLEGLSARINRTVSRTHLPPNKNKKTLRERARMPPKSLIQESGAHTFFPLYKAPARFLYDRQDEALSNMGHSARSALQQGFWLMSIFFIPAGLNTPGRLASQINKLENKSKA